MQIVIKIDEETYKDIKRGKIYSSYRDVPQESVVAIANGTPLPEGHGMLVDMSEVIVKLMQYYDGNKTIGQCLDEVHTVIEEDGGDAE